MKETPKIEAKRKAVAVWNTIARQQRRGLSTSGYATETVQRQTRRVLALCSTWLCHDVPEPIWTATVRELARETATKHGLTWSWCYEVVRQLLWLMDVDYMIEGLPVIRIGMPGKSNRRPLAVTVGGETRNDWIGDTAAGHLCELVEKGEYTFRHRNDRSRLLKAVPELRMHLEQIGTESDNGVRCVLGINVRARISFS